MGVGSLMRALLITATFFGAYYLTDNLPSPLATAFGLITLAGIFAGAVALAVKWVRNV